MRVCFGLLGGVFNHQDLHILDQSAPLRVKVGCVGECCYCGLFCGPRVRIVIGEHTSRVITSPLAVAFSFQCTSLAGDESCSLLEMETPNYSHTFHTFILLHGIAHMCLCFTSVVPLPQASVVFFVRDGVSPSIAVIPLSTPLGPLWAGQWVRGVASEDSLPSPLK